MKRMCAISILVAWCCGWIVRDSVSAQEEAKPAPEQPAEKEPEFKDARSKETYAEGVKLFQEKKYKDAAAKFKAVIKGASKPADRKQVNRWVDASQGGIRLDITLQQAARGLSHKHFLELDENFLNIIGTPIESAYRQVLSDMSGKVLNILEDFEFPSNTFSKKFGKTHIKDPARVYHGKGCIEWAQTEDLKGVQLRVAGKVPKNWTSYAGIVMWMNVEKPVRMEVIIKCPGKSQEGPDSLVAVHDARPAGKWERVYFDFGDLKKFRKVGKASLDNVVEFILQTPKKDFKLLIDCIALVKKDGAAPAPDTGKKK